MFGGLQDFRAVPVQHHRLRAERAADLARGGGAGDAVVAVGVVAGDPAGLVTGQLGGLAFPVRGLFPGGGAGERPEFQQRARCAGAVQTSDAVSLSSCLGNFLAGGWECGGFVVFGACGQAVVQAAEEAAEQVALGGGVPVAVVAAAVVVGAGAG
jgi:hypothetical protein